MLFFAILVIAIVSFFVLFAPEFIRGIVEVLTWIRPSLIAWVILGLVLSNTALAYRFSVRRKKKKLKGLLERLITIENLVFSFMFLFSIAHPFLVTLRDWVIATMEEYTKGFCIASIVSGCLLLLSMSYFTILELKSVCKSEKPKKSEVKKTENLPQSRDVNIDLYVPLTLTNKK